MSHEQTIRDTMDLTESTAEAYRKSVSIDPEVDYPFFSLEYQWLDKPHRHVFDLCNILDETQEKLEAAEKRVEDLTEAIRAYLAADGVGANAQAHEILMDAWKKETEQ